MAERWSDGAMGVFGAFWRFWGKTDPFNFFWIISCIKYGGGEVSCIYWDIHLKNIGSTIRQ